MKQLHGNGIKILNIFNVFEISMLIYFWLIEIGIYGLIIMDEYKNNSLYWVSFISLIFIPIICMGEGYDFSMRASIPCLIVCMYFIIDFLLNKNIKEKAKKYILIILLCIGAITSLFEYARAIYVVSATKNIRAVADEIVSFSGFDSKFLPNFLATNVSETSIFFKYMVK